MFKRTILFGLLVLTVVLGVVACGGNNDTPVSPGVTVRSSTLTGAQESPPNASTATGRGAVVVNQDTGEITGGLNFTGFTPTSGGHHIHQAPSGNPTANGPVIINLALAPSGGVATIPAGTRLTADQLVALRAGELYFNVHSATFPGGEIRGQINTQGGVSAGIARLTGAQEVPAVVSAATGFGTLVYDSTTRNIIVAYATHNVANDSNAHIHTGAIGVSGPANVLNPMVRGTGVWTAPSPTPTLTEQNVTDIAAGNTYFNVHSPAFLGGEIRGQICDPLVLTSCR